MRLMLTPCSSLRAWMLLLAATLLSLASAAGAAQTKAAAGLAPAVTNALPLVPQIPKSLFSVPTTPQEGKDPFFPRSTRLFNDAVVKTNQQPGGVVVELRLNGISGAADHRLAIINNRTFETGEEGEVVSNAGRSRIICKDITADSVRVLIGGVERILRLRSR